MSETSDWSQQMMFMDDGEQISSQGSEDGPLPSDSPDMTDLLGQPPSLASRSPRQGKGEGKPTSDTSGPCSETSLTLQDRLSFSVSKWLQERGETGSLEYELTWKLWDMKSGPQICALRARARRIFVNVSSGELCDGDGVPVKGWPTPNTPSGGPNTRPTPKHTGGMDLDGAALMAGWPTPNANKNTKNRKDPKKMKEGGTQTCLADAAWMTRWALAGWPTVTTSDDNQNMEKRRERGKKWGFGEALTLGTAARMAGWPTPDAAAMNADADPVKQQERRERLKEKWGNSNGAGATLGFAAHLPGTPIFGATLLSSLASTGKRGVLDAAFSRWLMGYPESWDKASPSFEQYEKAQALIAEDDSRDTGTPSSPK